MSGALLDLKSFDLLIKGLVLINQSAKDLYLTPFTECLLLFKKNLLIHYLAKLVNLRLNTPRSFILISDLTLLLIPLVEYLLRNIVILIWPEALQKVS